MNLRSLDSPTYHLCQWRVSDCRAFTSLVRPLWSLASLDTTDQFSRSVNRPVHKLAVVFTCILRKHSSRLRHVSLTLHRCKRCSNSRKASCVLTAAFFTSSLSTVESLVPDVLRVLAVFSNARSGIHLNHCRQIPLDVDADGSFTISAFGLCSHRDTACQQSPTYSCFTDLLW